MLYNGTARIGLADGIVVTPSHNPPEDGGFKYNPPDGGPAGTQITAWIQDRANYCCATGNERQDALRAARAAAGTGTTLDDVRLRAGRRGGHRRGARRRGRFGADPLGGATPYWGPIADRMELDLTWSIRRRSHVWVYDPGPRREDPHGLLDPYAMAS